jgi:hypothetical protein
MPIDDNHLGTNADGSPNAEYCFQCLQNGCFTADLTKEEMADFCAQFVEEFNRHNDKILSRDAFKYVLDALLAKLKRWNLPPEQLPPVASITIQKRAIDEINALGIRALPPIDKLKVLRGELINWKYNVHGNCIKVLDDNISYWCMQVEKTDGSKRMYGIACDDNYIIVNECGGTKEDSRLVLLKRRT